MMYTLEYMNRELLMLKVKEVISKHGLGTQAQTQTQVVMVGSGSLQTITLMQIIMMNTKPILELLSHQQEHTIMQVGFPLMVGRPTNMVAIHQVGEVYGMVQHMLAACLLSMQM